MARNSWKTVTVATLLLSLSGDLAKGKKRGEEKGSGYFRATSKSSLTLRRESLGKENGEQDVSLKPLGGILRVTDPVQ